MKFLKSLHRLVAFVMLLALGLVTHLHAQTLVPTQSARSFFSTIGSVGTTLSYAVVSANGFGVPRVTYINATSDKAGSKLLFYTSGNGIQITATGASGQAVVTAIGTGNFSANDICVVRHVVTDTYERLVVSSVAATTVTFTANLATAVASGDFVYKMTAGPTIGVGAATKELNAYGGAVFNGLGARPVLIDLDGTSACQINDVSGVFTITQR